jgi:archaellum component FlaG (FlaF/FlaG flagellin family)
MRGIMIGAVVAALSVPFAAGAAEDEAYTYTLYVKNGDPTTENVDLTVFVDREYATREALRFSDVDEVRVIELELEPGPHRIVIQALKVTDAIEEEMDVAEEGSAEVLVSFDRTVETVPPEAAVAPEPYSTP